MSFTREVENQITKIMGSYLLKGYTLLDSHCENCQTPLMKTKTSNDYCIYCSEIEKNINSVKTNEGSDGGAVIKDIKYEEESKTRHRNDLNSDSINLNTNRVEAKEDIERTVAIVHNKIKWASNRLKSCDQISDCMQLIGLIKSSADLILTLNQLTRNQ